MILTWPKASRLLTKESNDASKNRSLFPAETRARKFLCWRQSNVKRKTWQDKFCWRRNLQTWSFKTEEKMVSYRGFFFFFFFFCCCCCNHCIFERQPLLVWMRLNLMQRTRWDFVPTKLVFHGVLIDQVLCWRAGTAIPSLYRPAVTHIRNTLKTNLISVGVHALHSFASALKFTSTGTSLFWAAAKGLEDIVELLIWNGARVGARNKTHCTPLHAACDANHVSTARSAPLWYIILIPKQDRGFSASFFLLWWWLRRGGGVSVFHRANDDTKWLPKVAWRCLHCLAGTLLSRLSSGTHKAVSLTPLQWHLQRNGKQH